MIHEPTALALLACASSMGVILCLWLRGPPSASSRILWGSMIALAGDALCTGVSPFFQTTTAWENIQRAGMLARGGAVFGLALFSLTYARVNYGEFLRWWRWPLAGVAVVMLGLTVTGWDDLLTRERLTGSVTGGGLTLNRAGSFMLTLQLLLAALALMNMERTLKAAVGTLRWKVKFITLGVGVVLASHIYTTTQTLIPGMVDPRLNEVNLVALLVGGALVMASLLRTPMGTGDLYISTHLLFRSLTIVVIGGYLILVGLTSRLLFSGNATFLFLPIKVLALMVALVALGIVLLSDRVRQKTKLLLSRHLLRPRYDHRQIWATLFSQTSQAADATSFCRDTANWLSETFEFLSVSIWIIDEPLAQLSFGGSTQTSEPTVVPPPRTSPHPLLQALRKSGDLVDLDTASGDWITWLNVLAPDTFPPGGPRLCLPLLAGQDLVGMMVLTDRVQRVPLSAEERDLIRTLATHVAARLFVYRLSEQVLQTKQMEAFQAMSAFFVHDLKNTASTLSLMLQNLPRHFDDPVFRNDALRAVTKSVNQLNAMITKLALFRQGMAIKPVPANVNPVVTAAVAEVTVPAGVELICELRPVPDIPLDAELYRKVLVNFIINACEAMRQGGKLVIGSESRAPWVLVTITDHGTGMTADFIRDSLFHPFKTTKPQGLGIGLFHAKVIVEAHGGRIEVTSEPGKGSQFRIWLPVQGGTHESPATHRG